MEINFLHKLSFFLLFNFIIIINILYDEFYILHFLFIIIIINILLLIEIFNYLNYQSYVISFFDIFILI